MKMKRIYLIMPEEVFPEGYVLLALPLRQEGLHVLVEPGLVPAGHVVHLHVGTDLYWAQYNTDGF